MFRNELSLTPCKHHDMSTMKKLAVIQRDLRRDIAACTLCAPHLASGPRPVVQFSSTARILIIGQAPGSKVHASGVPWDDPSGDRLRDWTGIASVDFYNAEKINLVPMGFCYPGKGKSGDLPPRPECAPTWHGVILQLLAPERLTLLVGSYAQAYYLPDYAKLSLTEKVQAFKTFLPNVIPLPHPSWRSTNWMKQNPWFEADVLPVLREAIQSRLA